LGVLNDQAVTHRLLEELQENGGRDAWRSIGEVAGWNARQASTRLAVLGRAWDAFSKQKPFWKP